jgi:DNA-directed RNA polymerase specialized sigma24 family protein
MERFGPSGRVQGMDARAARGTELAVAGKAEPAVRSFEGFYEGARPSLYRALALTLHYPDLAAEAVDEAMVRAYQRWSKVAPTTTLPAGSTGSE